MHTLEALFGETRLKQYKATSLDESFAHQCTVLKLGLKSRFVSLFKLFVISQHSVEPPVIRSSNAVSRLATPVAKMHRL